MTSIQRIHPIAFALALAIMAASGLTGCAAFQSRIAPEGGLSLQTAGFQEGIADTGDLTVAYAVASEPAARQIRVRGGVRSVRYRADKVNVYLNLLDNDGRVVQKTVLYASDYRPNSTYFRRPSTFDTTVELPPEATAIGFSSYVQRSHGRR